MMCRQAVKPLWVLGLFVVCCQSLLSGASAQERGLAYSPYSSDKNNFCLSASDVARDLKILAQYTSYLRLYGVAACLPATQQILAFAEKNSMRVMLGLWIGSDSKSNEEELAALPGLLSGYSGIIQSVAVGNEPVSFLGLEPSFVLPLVKRGRDLVKRVSSIPVTSVEIASVWDKVSEQGSYAAQLLPEIDFVGVNAHPYFEGLPATCQGLNITGCYDAATWAVQRVQGLQKSLGKRVVLAETGFPTAGERCCNYRPSGFPSSAPLFMAAPSVAASAAMLASFVSQAAFAGISYYYFEPFDADWKRTYAPCSFCSPLDSCSNGQCTYE
ncbi:glycoside hydrolase superfamily [Haematococcus lacustris]